MIRESEGFLQSVFDGIQDGISVLDTGLNITKANSWVEKKYSDQIPLVGKECFIEIRKLLIIKKLLGNIFNKFIS